MLDKYDLKKIKDCRFYSQRCKSFVEIKGTQFILKDQIIDLKEVSILHEETQDLIADLIRESKTKQRLERRKSHTFGKDVYLLGEDKHGYTYWLEEPKWDCGWYWGFGYVETYTNRKYPERSRDIDSHQHFSSFIGHQEYWDSEKGCWVVGEHIHNVYDNPVFVETTFSHDEGWKLTELFTQFYLLQKMSAFCHKERPGCHIAASPVDHGNMKEWNEHINKIMIPKVTAKILEILSP